MNIRIRAVGLALVSLSLSCAPSAIELASLGAAETATLDAAGGAITVSAGEHAMLLEVPATALTEAVEISVEPVEIAGLEGVPAVRFAPAGLVFDLAATLVVTPAPAGEVLLGITFEDGDAVGALVFVAPDERGGVSIPIEHFSGAAIGDRARINSRLSEDDIAFAQEVDDLKTSEALGLGVRLRSVIEPAVARADGSFAKLKAAGTLFAEWSAAVQTATIDDFPTSLGGNETFRAASERVRLALVAKGESLQAKFEEPVCSDPGLEVKAIRGWLDLHGEIVAVLQTVGGTRPSGVKCARAEIVADGDAVLSAATASVSVDVRFELVGPNDERAPLGPMEFLFNETRGAVGPTFLAGDDGTATAVFARPSAPRPHAVVVVVTANLEGLGLGDVFAPPTTFIASEPLALAARATPASLASTVATSVICATATADGAPVDAFGMRLSTAGPGSVDGSEFLASAGTAGEACLNYTAPAVRPGVVTPVSITVTGDVDGAPVSTTVTVSLLPPAGTVTVGASRTAFVAVELPGTCLEGLDACSDPRTVTAPTSFSDFTEDIDFATVDPSGRAQGTQDTTIAADGTIHSTGSTLAFESSSQATSGTFTARSELFVELIVEGGPVSFTLAGQILGNIVDAPGSAVTTVDFAGVNHVAPVPGAKSGDSIDDFNDTGVLQPGTYILEIVSTAVQPAADARDFRGSFTVDLTFGPP